MTSCTDFLHSYDHLILDRDGVITDDQSGYATLMWLPQAQEALALLAQQGKTISIATNQGAIGKGLVSIAQVEFIHEQLRQHIVSSGGRVGKIECCPHLPSDGCQCRKPQPAMLANAMMGSNVGQERTVFIGDQTTDYYAATAAGIDFMLVLTGYGENTLQFLRSNCCIASFAWAQSLYHIAIGEVNLA